MAQTRTTHAPALATPSRSRRAFPLIECAAIALFAAAVTFVATKTHYLEMVRASGLYSYRAQRELQPLAEKYGPAHYSRDMEEFIIRDYFQDRRGGVFLDVGANHYRDESNTYFLETALGWSGVAIDALPEFGPDYLKHRPNTRFVAMFASDVTDSTVTFFVPKENKLVASATHEFTVREGAPGEARQVPTTTLNAVLEQAKIERIDFLSMDIELAEPKALAGFDVGRYRPSLVCIESHPDVRQQILDYFAAHDYVVVGKYLRMDPNNLYFQPRAGTNGL